MDSADKFFNYNGIIYPVVPQVYYSGKMTPIKQVYVNADIPAGGYADGQSPFPSKVQQIWAKDSGILKFVWPHTQTLSINRGIYAAQNDYNKSGHQILRQSFYWNGIQCRLPIGWLGRISVWQSANKSNNTEPTNTAPNALNLYSGYNNINSTVNINLMDHETKQSDVLFATTPIAGGQCNNGLFGRTAGLPAVSPNKVVKKDNTVFNFTYCHEFTTPITKSWSGFIFDWDGWVNKSTLTVQEYINVNLSVTSTGAKRPVLLPRYIENGYYLTGAVFGSPILNRFNVVDSNRQEVRLKQRINVDAQNNWQIALRIDGMHFSSDTIYEWAPQAVTIGGVAMSYTQVTDYLQVTVPLPSRSDPRWTIIKSAAAHGNGRYWHWGWHSRPSTPAVIGYRWMRLALDVIMPDGGKLSENTDNLPMTVYIVADE